MPTKIIAVTRMINKIAIERTRLLGIAYSTKYDICHTYICFKNNLIRQT
jgi:hypothetical protein